jgi:hypothetical protein
MSRMLHLMMIPSNALCDFLHVAGEAERGVVRMLANTLFWTGMGVLLVWVVS